MTESPDATSPEEGEKLPKVTNKRVSINQRRAFLIRNLRARGAVSMAVLGQYLDIENAPSQAALDGDLEFLNSLGFSVSLVESAGRRYFVDSTARHLGAKSERTDLNHSSKQAIAIAAVSLVLGLPAKEVRPGDDKIRIPEEVKKRERLNMTNPELNHLWCSKELRDFFRLNDSTPAANKMEKLRSQLERLWSESNLSIFCDAGTTNDHMGNVLRDVFLPTSFSQLRNLQVCTNGRVLFNAIADPEVCAKAIVTGGYQLGVDGSTDSIAGSYTEAWLKATDGILRFGVCFIGCTSIDAVQGFLISDSYEEKAIKEIVMSPNRSRIRVINVDRSKFEKVPMREGFRFASICPEQVDLIITNEAVPGELAEVAGLIQRVRRMGVPVIEVPMPPKEKLPHFSDMKRGREIRARLDFDRLDLLLCKLGLKVERGSEATLDREKISDESSEKPFLLPTKYVSRSVELFLNAAVDFFLDDTTPAGEKIKRQLVERFQEYRMSTFLAPRDPLREPTQRDSA